MLTALINVLGFTLRLMILIEANLFVDNGVVYTSDFSSHPNMPRTAFDCHVVQVKKVIGNWKGRIFLRFWCYSYTTPLQRGHVEC